MATKLICDCCGQEIPQGEPVYEVEIAAHCKTKDDDKKAVRRDVCARCVEIMAKDVIPFPSPYTVTPWWYDRNPHILGTDENPFRPFVNYYGGKLR